MIFPAAATNFSTDVRTNIEIIFAPDHWISGQAAANRTFRVDNVPPGTWGFAADVYSADYSPSRVKLIGAAGRRIIVPEKPGAAATKPLDLGTVEPVIVQLRNVGDMVPLFEVKTSDGNAFKLAEHRGQYVLLDFEGYHETNRETESVKAVLASFGKRDQMAVLTLKAPSPWLRETAGAGHEDFPWPQTIWRICRRI